MFKKLLFLLLLVNIAYGETLEEVINTALQESPFLKTYIYQAKAVEGQVLKSKANKNPTLQLEFGRIYSQINGESGLNLTSLSVQQPLRLWGEKKFALKSAKLKQLSFDRFYQFQKNNLISNVYKTFFKALAVKEKIKIKNQEIQTVQELYNFLQKSYQMGEIIQLDLLRAEKDLNITKFQLEKLKSDYQAQLNMLSAFVGKNIQDVEGNFYQFKEIKNIDINNLPEIAYLQHLIESLDQQIKRQKALAKPQISVGFVAGEDEVDLGKYEFGFSLSSTIPVFYKRQGEILTFINQKKVYISKIQQKKLMYKSTLTSIKNQLSVLKEQYEKLSTKVIPGVSEALKIGERSYRLRTITFFEFSNIRKQYYETLYYKVQIATDIHSLYGDYIKIGGLK